jgi:hypothetical protein
VSQVHFHLEALGLARAMRASFQLGPFDQSL